MPCLAGTAPPQPDVREVAAILREAERVPPPGASVLASQLARLGKDAIPDLLSVLAHGLEEGGPPGALEQDALLQALASFGAPSIRAVAEARLRSEAPPEDRGALLRVLGRVGSSQDIALARRAAECGGADGLEPAILEAIAGILQRDPRGVEPVRRWILESTPDLGTTVVRAAGASGCGAALPMLAGLLGYRSILDPVLISEIGRIADGAPKPIDRAVTEPVAGFLDGDDPQLVREAALALGRAEDCDSAEQLIALLGHEDRGVREAVSWALERSTGMRFRGDAVRWSSWLRVESLWFEQEGPKLPYRLRSQELGIAARALGQISQHRYRRHQLAQEAGAALENESASVRALACLTLARLASSAAIPALREALEDPDDSVIRAATGALKVLGVAPAAEEALTEGPEPLPLKEDPL